MSRSIDILVVLAMIATLGCIGKTYTSVNEVVINKGSRGEKFVGVVEVFSCLEADEEGQWCRVTDYRTDEPKEIWVFNGINSTLGLGDVIELRGKVGEATIRTRHRFEEDVMFIDMENVRFLED
ncbi:MAG: hypothetical protein ACE5HY_02140 [Candidatus Hydrothermarchaeales archaeon]